MMTQPIKMVKEPIPIKFRPGLSVEPPLLAPELVVLWVASNKKNQQGCD
jgi:hypothetical protein